MVLAVAAGVGAPARAADPRTEAAREHSRQGDAYYKLEKYSNAIGEYEQAYLSKPDPSFLFNIAQCHRLMGQGAEAVNFYRRFLNDAPPNAPSRAVAEKHIRDLDDSAKSATAEPPPTTPAPVTPLPPANAPLASAPGGPPAATGPAVAAPVAVEATNPTSASATTPVVENSGPSASNDQKPFYYRWWFWTAVGAVVAAGVVIGVVASRHDPSCPEMTMCQ